MCRGKGCMGVRVQGPQMHEAVTDALMHHRAQGHKGHRCMRRSQMLLCTTGCKGVWVQGPQMHEAVTDAPMHHRAHGYKGARATDA